MQGAAPDEPGSFQSPDGKRIVSLLRENQRRCNSLFIYSDDEGATWPVRREVYPGAYAYSILGVLPDGAIAPL